MVLSSLYEGFCSPASLHENRSFAVFLPSLCTAANISLGSFIPTVYDTTDSFFKKGFPDARHNPSILLSLPLLALVSIIPSGHWLLGHNRSKVQANQFFTYDPSFHRTLFGGLVRDSQNRTVTLNKMTWNLILNGSLDLGPVGDFPFVLWLTRSVDWISFRPQDYRQTLSDTLLIYPLSILPPPNKLHCNTSVSWFDLTVSAACSLCHDPLEDIIHLLITCSFTWSMWQEILSRFASYIELHPGDA
ncbi:hypothetical protein G6F46_007032 [Rhizopus delemar]|uniref:Uncharacterized protein n=2 Tax=Rhizopus TaxID=4842 RepID=A0A9P6Z5Q7_9FUNG|nr:hypothetical protein G6F55_005532 [Rhizopus delemar]KAG1539709.1 hypothetical protein G6F51_008967 [Rhizopus arrhizus]KAG1497446.1 hypothetical protein G6F54_005761 [Rhizopus delemar]KAG1511478.1 hypothetical protein G6F53_005911 [Rhizopus delemar]KAG1525435.1 hypothetical protein G6F52_003329 [Rhizopus delemar]